MKGGERQSRSSGKTIRKAILLLVVFGVVITVALCLTVFRDRFDVGSIARFFSSLDAKYIDTGEDLFRFDGGRENRYAMMGDKLVVLSTDNLTVFDAGGRVSLSHQKAFTNPELSTSGGVALAYDRGSVSAVLAKDVAVSSDFQAEGTIISASLNPQSWYCFVERQSGYKGIVNVYDSSQTKRFQWYSAENYIADAVISNDSKKLTVACFGQEQGRFVTKIHIFDISDKEQSNHYDIMDSMALSVQYIAADRICVVAEDRIVMLDEKGGLIAEKLFDGKHLRSYAYGDGFVAVVLSRHAAGGQCEVITLDKQGSQLGAMTLDEAPTDISASGDKLAIVVGAELRLTNKQFEEPFVWDKMPDAQSALAYPDGSAMLIGSGRAAYITR